MPRPVLALIGDFLQLLALGLRSHTHLAAENLFLRKQLAFYGERCVKPRRLDDATRLTLVVLARFIEWRRLLTVVQPDTLLRWHRQAFRLLWRRKSRHRGRPQLPTHLQELIAEMTRANRTWGEERIAAELLLKLGISTSPRTVRRYMQRPVPSGRGVGTQMWSTFLRNHTREPAVTSHPPALAVRCPAFATVAVGVMVKGARAAGIGNFDERIESSRPSDHPYHEHGRSTA